MTGIGNRIIDLGVIDDGSGAALIASETDGQIGGFVGHRVSKWNGMTWSQLGGNMNGDAMDMVQFDDGSGPALYIGGTYTHAGGVVVNHVAKFNGGNWTALNAGVENAVSAMAVFDDGTGDALFVGSNYTTQPLGAPEWRVEKWNGLTWSLVGSLQPGGVRALTVFDDGSGPALYAGGFDAPGAFPSSSLRRLNSGNWVDVLPGGLDGTVEALEVYDDGTGDALYAGGEFIIGAPVTTENIARWDGSGSWSALGSGLGPGSNHTVIELTTFDDGTGPALYAAGSFIASGATALNQIAKWDGLAWTPLGSGISQSEVGTLAAFDDGTGASLYAGGNMTIAPDSGDGPISKWGSPVSCGLGQGYCFGDGTSSPCPCGNTGGAGAGCENSIGQGGAMLTAFGQSSFNNDTFGLDISGAPASVPSLILLANNQLNQGMGAPAGSGLLCVGGAVRRSQIQLTSISGAVSFVDFRGSPFGNAAFGIGAPVNYQFFYRDNASPCSFAPFNFSGGWSEVWQQ